MTSDPACVVLHLCGGPYVTLGRQRREVPEGSKRLLAYVSLRRSRVQRRHAAAALWPGAGAVRASGNLRSALWRLRTAGVDLLAADKWSLRLRDGVLVDVHVMDDWAARLTRGAPGPADLAVLPSLSDALELLPGWYDDWAIAERERVRRRLLDALEALSRALTRAGRPGEAVEAAMAAATADPLRESAQRALIHAHAAEGNWIEARRAYDAYRDLLRRELGVEPSPDLSARLPRARRFAPV
ncbi:BTAD domain-containing putative transcriptional regulator [Actinoplanes sp. NPDC051513]|uniref:AfsR/SARP family transcriptional regulator n=1 Tax=Actinoplanes sp. NPDC051513 TaxID=3363908 RepID=UPI0037AF7AAF